MPSKTMQDKSKEQLSNNRKYYLFAFKIMGDFGVSIAVPVVLFAYIGQKLDDYYNTKMIFTIIGFVIAAALTAKLIYKKAKKYGEEYQKL
jgi:F0F1-type ATP synthase assembly protein I